LPKLGHGCDDMQLTERILQERRAVYRYQFRVADCIEDHVLWFEIAIHDSTSVKVDQRLNGTRRVEPGGCVVERVPVTTITRQS